MWLLSTDTARLHCFPSPELVPNGYAILSHVWDENEMSVLGKGDMPLWRSLHGRLSKIELSLFTNMHVTARFRPRAAPRTGALE